MKKNTELLVDLGTITFYETPSEVSMGTTTRKALLALALVASCAGAAPLEESAARLTARYAGQPGFAGARVLNDYLAISTKFFEARLRFSKELLMGFDGIPIQVDFGSAETDCYLALNPPPAPPHGTLALGFIDVPLSQDYLLRHYTAEGIRRHKAGEPIRPEDKRPLFGFEKVEHWLRAALATQGPAFFPRSLVRVMIEKEKNEPLIVGRWRNTEGMEVVAVATMAVAGSDPVTLDTNLDTLPPLGPRPPTKEKLWILTMRFRNLEQMLSALDQKEVLLADPQPAAN